MHPRTWNEIAFGVTTNDQKPPKTQFSLVCCAPPLGCLIWKETLVKSSLEFSPQQNRESKETHFFFQDVNIFFKETYAITLLWQRKKKWRHHPRPSYHFFPKSDITTPDETPVDQGISTIKKNTPITGKLRAANVFSIGYPRQIQVREWNDKSLGYFELF